MEFVGNLQNVQCVYSSFTCIRRSHCNNSKLSQYQKRQVPDTEWLVITDYKDNAYFCLFFLLGNS